jgi:hypothetical protein
MALTQSKYPILQFLSDYNRCSQCGTVQVSIRKEMAMEEEYSCIQESRNPRTWTAESSSWKRIGSSLQRKGCRLQEVPAAYEACF